jgi:multidrug resistance efflux pump
VVREKRLESDRDGREDPVVNRKTLVLTALLLAAGAVALGFYWPFRSGPQALRLQGVVEIQEVRLGSKVGGRVKKIYIAEGDPVKPGDELVEFEVPELQAQKTQLEAKVKAAEAELERILNGPRPQEKDASYAAMLSAKARWDRIKAGWRVEEKEQVQNDLEAAEAELKQTKEDYERELQIYRAKSGSRAFLDAAFAARDRASARLRAAKARDEMYKAGSRKEDIAEAAAEFEKSRANLKLLEAGSREEDKAEARAKLADARAKLAELEVNLKEAMVVAPEHAIVEVLAVRKGDLVSPNQPVLRVLRAEDLWVKVFVPETQLGRIRLHQTVDVTIDSYPGKVFQGEVFQVASISEFLPRNIQSVDERRNQVFAVKIRVANPQGIFKAGMAAEVTVPLAD